MRLTKLTSAYPDYLAAYYAKFPLESARPYQEQFLNYAADCSPWTFPWGPALEKFGVQSSLIVHNARPMAEAWWRERHTSTPPSDREITVAMLRELRPEVLWTDEYDPILLAKIREEVPSIRLILGWVGSAVPESPGLKMLDLILSCAPESVAALTQKGYRAQHLHHSFNPHVNAHISAHHVQRQVSFIGQFLPHASFHAQRRQMFEKLIQLGIRPEIFSQSALIQKTDVLRAVAAAGVYQVNRCLQFLSLSEETLARIPILSRVAMDRGMPRLPLKGRMAPFLKPPVYGLDMYQVIAESSVTLNIHADSSPEYASNMRLFETTGVGGCLLTDWRQNIGELFEPDTEVVTYKNSDECREKILWLLDHPQKRDEIARAGQQRTLRDHTIHQRVEPLMSAVREGLARL